MATTLYNCSHCASSKPLSEFPPSKAKNRHQWCRACLRESARKRIGAVEREVKCHRCEAGFVSAFAKAKFCSRSCKDDFRRESERREREQAKPERWCVHCGEALPRSMRADARFCSERCNSAAHHLKRAPERRGFGRRRDVARAYVMARDRMVCHLCGRRVRVDELHLDHVIPLSLGGSHDVGNLRVAHARCNTAKGARSRNEQIMLFG